MSVEKNVTLKDISEKLGVSVTTVYKALNNKPKVGSVLREKIINTAVEMEYTPNRVAQALVRKPMSIGAIMTKHPEEFMSYIEQGMRSAFKELESFNVTGIMKVVDGKEKIERAWKSLYESNVSGILSCFNNSNKGISDIVDEMPGFNIPIVAVTTAPFDDTPYIGEFAVSGETLGGMAGQFLGMICNAGDPVVCMVPDMNVSIHVDCVRAFKKESLSWKLDYRGEVLSSHSHDKTYTVTDKLLREQPDIRGLYVGSCNSYHVCKCIEDRGLAKQIHVIGHDLHPKLADCLRKDTLIASLFQNQKDHAHKSVVALFNYLWNEHSVFQSQYFRPELVLKANLDLYEEMY